MSKQKDTDKVIKWLKDIVGQKEAGVVVVYNVTTGDIMSFANDMCSHEISDILHQVLEGIRKSELEAAKKETLNELKALKKQPVKKESN